MAKNLSESELNPNVLTNLESGSEERGQVAGKPELCPADRGGLCTPIAPFLSQVITKDPR